MALTRTFSALLLGLSVALTSQVYVSPAAAKDSFHTVYSGQRLGSIAKRYRVGVDVLCAANGIKPSDTIRPGQKLLIPERGESVEEARARGEARKAASAPAEEPARAKAPAKPSKEAEKPAPKAAGPKASGGKPTWVVHTISPGQRLGSIAKRYRVPLEALTYANDINPKEPIKPGQKLVIPERDDASGESARKAADAGRVPGLKPAADLSPKASEAKSGKRISWTRYKKLPARRGYVTLIGLSSSWKGYVTQAGGKLQPAAVSAISRVLDASGLKGGIHPRLVRILAEVSDAFGGRPIRVVSGHRTASYARASRHALGHAIDFSIPGVPNEALRDYVLRLDQVGVGYYPNSSFIHLDVRGSKTYWVDHSGPGEAPRYSYIGKGPDPKTIK